MVISPDQALQQLKDGNERFVSGKATFSRNLTLQRRGEVVHSQNPWAIILTCSDSRVPAEPIFDCSFGDLFVIRVAGNIAAPTQLGSIEFAVQEFGTPLILVLGHSQCGAIGATLSAIQTHQTTSSDALQSIVEVIVPAVEQAMAIHPNASDDVLKDYAIRSNIHNSMRVLASGSEIIQRALAESRLKIAGAHYSLATGQVEFIG
jgi:carbonic anhydrase